MKIKELLISEKQWIQGSVARESSGLSVESENEFAVQWCLTGAVAKCYGFASIECISVMALLRDKIGLVTQWNDHPSRTFEEVKSLVERLDI